MFPITYRSNDRVLVMSPRLADCLWRRIEPLLRREDVLRVRPMCFGNEGTWKPFRLNECFKFNRYRPQTYFKPHIDGPWVPREDESSVYTVVVYLNDGNEFDGGATVFLDEQRNPIASVAPQRGAALVFNHDMVHEGETVRGPGAKYIVRTEIMFRRVDTASIPDPLSYKDDPDYQQTLTLYKQSYEHEQNGDIDRFTDTYLDAIKLQEAARVRTALQFGTAEQLMQEQLLPFEILLHVFSFLSSEQLLVLMTVCRAWYDMVRDGALWRERCCREWPLGAALGPIEARVDMDGTIQPDDATTFTKDWFGCYWQRKYMQKDFACVTFDFGSESVKAAYRRADKPQRLQTFLSVVAAIPGIADLHMRRCDYERFYCGQEALSMHPGHCTEVIKHGAPVRFAHLPELVSRVYVDFGARPERSSVIVAEPITGWSQRVAQQVTAMMFDTFAVPGLAIVNSAVLALCSVGRLDGVVVSLGRDVQAVAVVLEGRLVRSRAIPADATADSIGKAITHCLSSIDMSERESLGARPVVLLTGGRLSDVTVRASLLAQLRKLQFEPVCSADPLYDVVSGGSVYSESSLRKRLARRKGSEHGDRYERVAPFYGFIWRQKYWVAPRTFEEDD